MQGHNQGLPSAYAFVYRSIFIQGGAARPLLASQLPS